jgi:hypothetical protein
MLRVEWGWKKQQGIVREGNRLLGQQRRGVRVLYEREIHGYRRKTYLYQPVLGAAPRRIHLEENGDGVGA